MERVRARISVTGVAAEEAEDGLPELVNEFQDRPWLLNTHFSWDRDRSVLLVEAEAVGNDLRIQGGIVGFILDEVRDCVIACVKTSGDIRFDVEESVVVS